MTIFILLKTFLKFKNKLFDKYFFYFLGFLGFFTVFYIFFVNFIFYLMTTLPSIQLLKKFLSAVFDADSNAEIRSSGVAFLYLFALKYSCNPDIKVFSPNSWYKLSYISTPFT